MSLWTVGTHLRRVVAKLGVGTRAEMIARVIGDGLLDGGAGATAECDAALRRLTRAGAFHRGQLADRFAVTQLPLGVIVNERIWRGQFGDAVVEMLPDQRISEIHEDIGNP
jgi:hypothetical protein